MPTLLEALVRGPLLPILIFLLAFALIYAVLSKIKLFPSNGINAILAFVVALLVATTNKIVEILAIALPWYAAIMTIGIFILLIVAAFGIKDISNLGENPTILYTAISLAVIILFFSIAHVFQGEIREQLPGGSNYTNESIPSNWHQDFVRTFFHPNFLGVMVVFIIATLAIVFLSSTKEG